MESVKPPKVQTGNDSF